MDRAQVSNLDAPCKRLTHSRFQIHQYSTWDIVLVVRLVEEHVFTIAALGGPLLEYAFVVDSMLGAQTLPVHGAHWIESTL